MDKPLVRLVILGFLPEVLAGQQDRGEQLARQDFWLILSSLQLSGAERLNLQGGGLVGVVDESGLFLEDGREGNPLRDPGDGLVGEGAEARSFAAQILCRPGAVAAGPGEFPRDELKVRWGIHGGALIAPVPAIYDAMHTIYHGRAGSQGEKRRIFKNLLHSCLYVMVSSWY